MGLDRACLARSARSFPPLDAEPLHTCFDITSDRRYWRRQRVMSSVPRRPYPRIRPAKPGGRQW
eukprot:3257601-Alexandrium_andersonii.AAC.1